MPFNQDAFYKVIMNGLYEGQAVVNILYYRVAAAALPGGINLAGADTLALLVKERLWDDQLRAITSLKYMLQSVAIYPMDSDFAAITQLPYVLDVASSGERTGTSDGPALAVNLRFNLEPTTIIANVTPPKSGYIAWGPLLNADVEDDMVLTTAWRNTLYNAVQCYAIDLTSVIPPIQFWPIRIRTVSLAGIITVTGFADVQSVSVASKATFRRSRVPKSE